ncbi:uncharacterized protein LOC142227433 isoform X1 [Haematobia irritans]|uniref:uncharacterized protein LOC142227433 isoform X1 n=1 Tax=Haematobia irritans TaxID=7368 RepID=UPI003F4FC383
MKFLSKNKLLMSLSKLELEPDLDSIQKSMKDEVEYASYVVPDGRSPKFWWSEELKVGFRRQWAAAKKARLFPSYNNLEDARKATEHWKNMVAEAKKKCYLAKLDEINKSPNTKNAWKFINNIRGRNNPTRSIWNDENNAVYLEHLKNQVTGENVIIDFPLVNHFIEPFDFEEFILCLSGKRSQSAGGHDGITYNMIKSLSGISKRALLTAMNNAFLTNTIRDDWRIIKIVPIPKPKKNHNDPKNFRPISLISVFLKCINLMVKERISVHFDSVDIIPRRSFAYKKNSSTSTCINELLHRVALLKANNFKVVILSLDICDAYNCVKIDMLQRKLILSGLDTAYCNWIINFLSHRILKLSNSEVSVYNGLPQGSCLSPLLFNLYTASLHTLEDGNTTIFQYADDFIIMSYHRDFAEARSNLIDKVREFMDTCRNLNLSFNPSKSNTMYFAKNGFKNIDMVIDGTRVEQTKKLRFLGRIVTNSLSIKDHYDSISKETQNCVNMLKCLTSIRGGLHPNVALNVYKSIVRSKIEYVRTTAADAPKSINKRVERLQTDMLRRSLGVARSSPTHIVYALAHELPPEFRAVYLTAKELIKVQSRDKVLYDLVSDNPKVNSSYSYVYYEFPQIFDSIEHISNSLTSRKVTVRLNLLPNGKNNYPIDILKSIYLSEIDGYKNFNFTIFATDASVSTNSIGCGIVNVSTNQRFLFRIGFAASSTFGELWALVKALEIAIEHEDDKCVLFTDSLAACKIIASENTNNYIAATFHQKLQDSNINKCHIVWIPGHRGLNINELADETAKLAAECGAPLNPKLTPEEGLNKIRTALWNNWNLEFKKISLCKSIKASKLFEDVRIKPWFSKYMFNPQETKIINRLHTARTYDKPFLLKIGAISSDVCNECLDAESTHHTIFDCTKFDALRLKYNLTNRFTDVYDILATKDIDLYKSLVNFIIETNVSI